MLRAMLLYTMVIVGLGTIPANSPGQDASPRQTALWVRLNCVERGDNIGGGTAEIYFSCQFFSNTPMLEGITSKIGPVDFHDDPEKGLGQRYDFFNLTGYNINLHPGEWITGKIQVMEEDSDIVADFFNARAKLNELVAKAIKVIGDTNDPKAKVLAAAAEAATVIDKFIADQVRNGDDKVGAINVTIRNNDGKIGLTMTPTEYAKSIGTPKKEQTADGNTVEVHQFKLEGGDGKYEMNVWFGGDPKIEGKPPEEGKQLVANKTITRVRNGKQQEYKKYEIIRHTQK